MMREAPVVPPKFCSGTLTSKHILFKEPWVTPDTGTPKSSDLVKKNSKNPNVTKQQLTKKKESNNLKRNTKPKQMFQEKIQTQK